LQPKIAAQLLLDGVKIDPCTIIIMQYAYFSLRVNDSKMFLGQQ
jgi:hypothetical protein